MRVIVLMVLCVFVQNVMVSEGNKIIKALSEVRNEEDQWENQRRHNHRHRHRRHRHRSQRRDRRQRRQRKGNSKPIDLEKEAQQKLHVSFDMNPAMLSSRVSFARVKPSLPPWEIRVDADADESSQEVLEEERGQEGTPAADNSNPPSSKLPRGKIQDGQEHRDVTEKDKGAFGNAVEMRPSPSESLSRARRSAFDEYVHVPVCRSISDWVERTEAHDMWGNKVQVLQEIDIGGTRVNQYFYETYCRQEKASCLGIDSSRYFSVCKNKHIWAYAKIRTRVGDEGWNLIKIRGSCNCALYSKNPAGDLDIFGYRGNR